MDQCIRRNVQTHLDIIDPDFYNFEGKNYSAYNLLK